MQIQKDQVKGIPLSLCVIFQNHCKIRIFQFEPFEIFQSGNLQSIRNHHRYLK